MTPTVLFEDNHCLLVNKPAGMLSQADDTGDESLVDWAAAYWKVKYAKPGNVYVGLVHRLDRPTSGVVLLARTSKAAGRLADQFRVGLVRKTYLALCEGTIEDLCGSWEDHLIKDEIANKVRIGSPGERSSKRACVEFKVISQLDGKVGIVLQPLTGRGHQLRIQLASRGLPIVGDAKYGSKIWLAASDGRARIALHAIRLEFKHPTKGEPCEVQAPLPSDWPAEGFAFAGEWCDSSKPKAPPTH